MSGYSHSPIYNKVNDILQQQQQSYSDLTREVNLLQQQQQQSYSELARQVAILPQPCYSDSGLSLLVSDHQFRNCFPPLRLYSLPIRKSLQLFTKFIRITFNFPTIKTHLHLYPELSFHVTKLFILCQSSGGSTRE